MTTDDNIARGIGRTLAMASFARQQREATLPQPPSAPVPRISRQQLRAAQRRGARCFNEIRQVGQRFCIAPKGVPLTLRWADTGAVVGLHELPAGTRVTVCRDTGKVVRI